VPIERVWAKESKIHWIYAGCNPEIFWSTPHKRPRNLGCGSFLGGGVTTRLLGSRWWRGSVELGSHGSCYWRGLGVWVKPDMQLSEQSNDCWWARFLSGMDGLTQSYIFKQKLQNCEPIDLSRFVVGLGRDTWSTGHLPHSETHPREHNSKCSNHHQWCALPAKKALWSLIRLTSFPKTCFSTYLVMPSAAQTSCPHPTTFWDSDMKSK